MDVEVVFDDGGSRFASYRNVITEKETLEIVRATRAGIAMP